MTTTLSPDRIAPGAHPRRGVRLPERFDAHRVDVVDTLRPARGERLGIDASAVRFADVTAIQSLVNARLRFLDDGADLHLVDPSDTLRVTLELTGDTSLLTTGREVASCIA